MKLRAWPACIKGACCTKKYTLVSRLTLDMPDERVQVNSAAALTDDVTATDELRSLVASQVWVGQ